MKFELFQTTVRDYKRFTQQLPINYSTALWRNFFDSTYVAVQTRLMLLRKYTRNGRGNLYLSDIVTEAISCFPEHSDYLSEFQARFQHSCDQSLNHVLADGTERTLSESIDDTMYGLHLHADEERIHRIAQDNDLLRLYCVVTFVKGIEALVIELSDFLEVNGVRCIEEAHHFRAPVIHLESRDSELRNVIGSPYWSNLIGSDMTLEITDATSGDLLAQHTYEEWQMWATASAFMQLLAQEPFSYDEMKKVVFEPTISDWGDFSKAAAYYKTIPSPGMSSFIDYNEQRDVAYINVIPNIEKSLIIESPQIIAGVYVVTLVKDQRLGEWRVHAFGAHLDPIIRD